VKFQAKGMDDEIQMGAVSGLGDMRAPEATAALISGLAHYSRQNRELALDALLRDADRMKALLDAVAAGKIAADQIGDKRVRALKDHRDPAVRKRAREILPR
jgi:HEAT repeat protein